MASVSVGFSHDAIVAHARESVARSRCMYPQTMRPVPNACVVCQGCVSVSACGTRGHACQPLLLQRLLHRQLRRSSSNLKPGTKHFRNGVRVARAQPSGPAALMVKTRSQRGDDAEPLIASAYGPLGIGFLWLSWNPSLQALAQPSRRRRKFPCLYLFSIFSLCIIFRGTAPSPRRKAIEAA